MLSARKCSWLLASLWFLLSAAISLLAGLVLLSSLVYALTAGAVDGSMGNGALWVQNLTVLGRSTLVALGALVLSIPFALAYVYTLHQLRRGALLTLMNLLTQAHLTVPSLLFGLVGAAALVPMFAAWGSGWALFCVILVLAFMILPTVVVSLERVFVSISPAVFRTSVSLGATTGRAFLFGVFPKAWRGLVSGCFFALSRLLSDTAAVLLLVEALPVESPFSAGLLTTQLFTAATSGSSFSAYWCPMLILLVVSLVLSIVAHQLEAEVK